MKAAITTKGILLPDFNKPPITKTEQAIISAARQVVAYEWDDQTDENTPRGDTILALKNAILVDKRARKGRK
jgi:hypothetical protein